MIRHIVLFKFKKGVTEQEKTSLIRELENLGKIIGHVRSLEVARDEARKHNSYDLALNAVFDSLADVEAYAVHPAHVKVVDTINRLCEAHVKIDYPTKWVAI